MPEEIQGHSVETEPQSHLLRYVLLAVAMLYVIVSLYFIVDMSGRIAKLEDSQKSANEQTAQLMKKLGVTETSLRQAEASQEALATKLGSTQKEVVARTAQLSKAQKEAEA